MGAAMVGATLLLVAVTLALPVPWLAAVILAAVLLAAGVMLLAWGWRAFPKRPLAQTAGRIANDVTKVKERMA
jgi:protein-S-isoprenylcysteine O-methyltransferase Ste14